MSSGRRSRCKAGNRDGNETLIVETLEARGFHVDRISGVGVPDLLVSRHKSVWLVEVKQPKAVYTSAQIQWRAKWLGPQIWCLRTVDEALKFPEVQP